MNEKVARIVNLLFQDIAPSEEVFALREEVLNNCQEHFDDLIRSGLSEEEGLAAVAESLKGMDEVLREYPRKEAAPKEEPAAEPVGEKEEVSDRAPSLSSFRPDQIVAIDAQLANCELEVCCSEEDTCALEVNGDVRMRLEEDGTLRLWQERVKDNLLRGVNWEESLNSFEQLGNMLSRLGQNLSRVISQGLNQGVAESRATIRLPQSVHPVARIRTTSGNISWQDVIPGEALILRTTSGNINMKADREYILPHVEAASMSGDLDLSLSAEDLKVSSVSGDLFFRGDARHLNMNTTSGDTDAAGVLAEAELNTTSGDLSLELTSEDPADISVNSVSGDIELRLPHNVEGISASLKSVSGEIRMRGVDQVDGADIRLKANTVSGDLRIYA